MLSTYLTALKFSPWLPYNSNIPIQHVDQYSPIPSYEFYKVCAREPDPCDDLSYVRSTWNYQWFESHATSIQAPNSWTIWAAVFPSVNRTAAFIQQSVSASPGESRDKVDGIHSLRVLLNQGRERSAQRQFLKDVLSARRKVKHLRKGVIFGQDKKIYCIQIRV